MPSSDVHPLKKGGRSDYSSKCERSTFEASIRLIPGTIIPDAPRERARGDARRRRVHLCISVCRRGQLDLDDRHPHPDRTLGLTRIDPRVGRLRFRCDRVRAFGRTESRSLSGAFVQSSQSWNWIRTPSLIGPSATYQSRLAHRSDRESTASVIGNPAR